MDKNCRIGFIGTGVMGSAMASNLMKAGHSVTVYNRTRAKADALIANGAKWADCPRDVALESDIVFTIVGFPADVEGVILGELGVLTGLRKGGIVCDMTTSSPALAKKIADFASEVGCFGLDAPVTGGDTGARTATLSIFCGGSKDAFERARPLLEIMGQKIMYCGEAGLGQQAKLANQIAVAGVMFSVCESMLYAQQAGINVTEWLELVVTGAAGSVAMQNLGMRILKGNFQPGFYIDHFVKDLGLCLEECRKLKLVLPGAELAEELYRSMQARGNGKMGTQDLINCLADLSGKKWQAPGE